MDKKRFQWTGEEFEEILQPSEKKEYTKENFELAKKWLDIRLQLNGITQEEYDKRLKELKEKYNIED